MAKTDWQMDDTVKPDDMNQIGTEINQNTDDLAAHLADYEQHVNDNVRHITSQERTKWNNAQLFKLTRDTGWNIQTNDLSSVPTDFNELTTPGDYYLGNGMANNPATGNGFLTVRSISPNHILHKFVPMLGDPIEYIRTYYNGVWEEWLSEGVQPYQLLAPGTYDLEAKGLFTIYKKASQPPGELVVNNIVGNSPTGSIVRVINDGGGGGITIKQDNILLGQTSDFTTNINFGLIDIVKGGAGEWYMTYPV